MKVLNQATKIAGADTTTDSQSGFRAYGKKAINTIQISKEGMSAGSEILIQIAENKLKIAEIPIIARYDIEETSSQNPVKHGVMVLYNIIGMISYRRPLPAFGIPGFILLIIGFVFGIMGNYPILYCISIPFHCVNDMRNICDAWTFAYDRALILNYLVMFVKNKKIL